MEVCLLEGVIHPCLNDSSDHDITFYYPVDSISVCKRTLWAFEGRAFNICLLVRRTRFDNRNLYRHKTLK